VDPLLPHPYPAPPDLLAPVHAFRDWRISPDGLTSPRTGSVWTSAVLAATCQPRTVDDFVRPPHAAPGHGCTCGIHAYFHPSHETSKVDYLGVTGIVSVWGHVEVHEHGVRAEFARVEALGVYERWTARQKSAVRAIADELGVDLVDLHELERAAPAYASPLPAALLPEAGHSRRKRRAPAPARVLIFGH
jgi:hypothetical protein